MIRYLAAGDTLRSEEPIWSAGGGRGGGGACLLLEHAGDEKIVNAAVQVLGDVGFANFTLRAVSDRLGGSVTMVTYYFPSREALLTEMLEQTLDDARAVQEELTAIEDPHDRLEAVVRYFLSSTTKRWPSSGHASRWSVTATSSRPFSST